MPLLVSKGVRLDVAYIHDRPGLRDAFVEAGTGVFCVGGRGGRVAWVKSAYELVREQRPDVVHTTLFEADLVGRTAAAVAGVPVVSSLATSAYGPEHLGNPDLNPWRVRAAQVADALSARAVVRFHAVSAHVADVMARRLAIPRRRIDVIWRGRDPVALGRRTEERRVSTRKLLGLRDDAPVILAVARHEHVKGLDVLLEALAIARQGNPALMVMVAGRQGRHTTAVMDAITRLQLEASVQILGERTDVSDLMCAADVLVLPSRREGLPGVLLEALALELPIVANDLPGVREAVGDDDVARIVRPLDPAALAAGIAATVADPAGAHRRARRGRTRFESAFTIDRSVDGLLAFYEKALRTTRAKRTSRRPQGLSETSGRVGR